ncbi:MAG: hypothetical protein AAGF12_05565 [Myxococcota bacterium]
MTPREMVAAMDWSVRPHSYGQSEPGVLTLWDADIEGNKTAAQEAGDETLGNLVCHQSVVSPAALALVDPLLIVAKSNHPRRHVAIETLEVFLSAATYAARVGAIAAASNPLAEGAFTPAPVLQVELAAIRKMQERIESLVETWAELARSEQLAWNVREACLGVLSHVVCDARVDAARRTVREVYAGLDHGKRESVAWLIELIARRESGKRC